MLLAYEGDEDNCTKTARRFRIGVSTLHLWRKQARDEGRRAPRPMGRGPAPLCGRLEVLGALVVERNDATLAEYADLLAARTGERRSTPVICPRSAPPIAASQMGWTAPDGIDVPKCGLLKPTHERCRPR